MERSLDEQIRALAQRNLAEHPTGDEPPSDLRHYAVPDEPGGSRTRWLVAAAAVVLLIAGSAAVVLRSTGDDSAPYVDTGTTSSISGPDHTQPTASTLPRPSTSPAPSGAESLADLTYFGYIRGIDSQARTITFDVAQKFSGEAANAAAEQDGAIQPGEGAPNDYWVRNSSPMTRTVPVAEDVVVTHIGCFSSGCAENYAGTFEGLAASFGPGSNPTPDLSDEYRGAKSAYWITIVGGAVVTIDEQYFP